LFNGDLKLKSTLSGPFGPTVIFFICVPNFSCQATSV
jgi:hypothetical protein